MPCALVLLALLGGCGPEEGDAVATAPLDEAAPSEVAAPVVAPEPAPPEAALPEPGPPAPTAHDVLLLIMHDEPLLPSEERLTGVLRDRLRRRHMDVELRDVTPEEASLAQLFLEASSAPTPATVASLPSTFGAATRVVILCAAPPRVRTDGDRVTQGFAGMLLFRPPSLEPAFVLSTDGGSSWRLTDDQWSSWLAGLLRNAEDS